MQGRMFSTDKLHVLFRQRLGHTFNGSILFDVSCMPFVSLLNGELEMDC